MKIPFTLDAWLKDKSRKVVDEDGDSVDPRLCSLGWLLERQDRLFFVTPEPELTNWQTFISGCLQKHGLLDCGAADRIAKSCSTELLDLATEEIGHKWVIRQESYQDGYINGFHDGRAEALKDLPMWKNNWDNLRSYKDISGLQYIVLNGKAMNVSDLEKLPGFNE